jgi:predicted ArsR family transcriptional regulator
MDEATQKGKILQYCAEHGSITIREAFEILDINSPSKRISELRKSGLYDVQAVEESRVNKAGETKTYKRYYISILEGSKAQ